MPLNIAAINLIISGERSDDRFAPLDATWEACLEKLAELPAMFCEPDGSFLWVTCDHPRRQVEGVVYDAAGQVQYVECWGECDASQWRQLVSAVSGSSTVVSLRDRRSGELIEAAALEHRFQESRPEAK